MIPRAWYFKEIEAHTKEIRKLLLLNGQIYNETETCKEHAKVEVYDLIFLVSELFDMSEITAAIPEKIHERFETKREEDKKMKLTEIEKQLELETNDMTFNGFCHDCDAPVEVLCSVNKGEIVISGGAMYNPIMGTPPIEHTFFKCDACFKNDKTLRNFAPCEIFSRVVGYLRPVEQWNIGKKEEFKQRKEYVV